MKAAYDLPLPPLFWALFAVWIFIIAVYKYKLDFFYVKKNLLIGSVIMFLIGFITNI